MKLAFTTAYLLLLSSTAVTSLSIPQSDLVMRDVARLFDSSESPVLEKRRGGGGGSKGGSSSSSSSSSSGGSSGGKSGSGGSSSSSSSSSSSGSSSSSSSKGSTGSTKSSTSSTSNSGGATHAGSGTQPAYAGNTYYAGGARTPYSAGAVSPSGVVPYVLTGAALGFVAGSLVGHSYYAYNYPQHYVYVDQSTHQNDSLPVICVCDEYSECGCDSNSNSTYYQSLFNGTVPSNTSVVTVEKVNGTETIVINGTLANGTTVADSSISAAPATKMAKITGYWVMVAVVISTVWAL